MAFSLDRPIYSGWGWNHCLIDEGFDVLQEEITEMFKLLRIEVNNRFDEIDIGITEGEIQETKYSLESK